MSVRKPIIFIILFRLYAMNIKPTSAAVRFIEFFVIMWSKPHCRFIVLNGCSTMDCLCAYISGFLAMFCLLISRTSANSCRSIISITKQKMLYKSFQFPFFCYKLFPSRTCGMQRFFVLKKKNIF